MNHYIIVTTTTDNKEDAEKIARFLVKKRLAACVQIAGPVASIYRWKGKVETDREWQCIIKSRQDFFDKIAEAVKSIHPYETPEIIAVPVVAGSRDYLDWMNDEMPVSYET
ncbi:MAG: divalent-cation tolerance protein CutA [Deltaproteobacteria bacterium]|nr:divalent-cation tolerance protein CutA [Deltaproteobacteria bacterium]